MRKKGYSIAFWWWAARWFVHIWFLKYLEENKANIVEVSWTSMGAIVAALVAMWKKPDEIIKIAKWIDYSKLIDIDLSYWLIKWKKVYKILEGIFWNMKIEDLEIPLKIIAANIETGETKIFESWYIKDAIRASISLAWIFVPYKIEDKLYVDWWIVNNLPVDVLKWKRIIWISALKDIKWPLKFKKQFLGFEVKSWFFNYNYQVLHRVILYMMKQNEIVSVKNLKRKAIIIRPDFWKLDFYDFDSIDDFIEIWYNESKKNLSKKIKKRILF